MAIYHCSISEVQRSRGQNAIAAIAYISRSKLQLKTTDSATGEKKTISYNYSSRKGLAHSVILAPDDAPNWVYDRQELWNRAERAETREDAETARKITIALPKELTLEQNIEFVEQFAMESLVSHGMIADINIHYDNEDNPHVHIQMTTRRLIKLLDNGEVTFGVKGRDWGRRQFLYYYRESVANLINKHLKKYGHLSQVSHLSHKDSGIDLMPGIHEGAAWHIKDSRLKLENEKILNENAAKIKENPELVFDKLSINKPVFTKEDIAVVLSDVLHAKLKVEVTRDSNTHNSNTDQTTNSGQNLINSKEITGGINNANSKETLEDINIQSSREFMTLYSKVLSSDKIGIVVKEDLKGRTLYALTKRLDLEERYKNLLQELNSSKSHSLNITEEQLIESLAKTSMGSNSIGSKIIHSVKTAAANIASNLTNNFTNSITQNIANFINNQAVNDQSNPIDDHNNHNSLSYEQRRAIVNILNGSDISILEGLPGTGKTYVMREIVSQYKKAGYRVIGTSTSSAASLNLASNAGIIAKNISLWRKEWQEANGKEFELALRADYYKEAQYQDNRPFLSNKDILIIDEASMVELSNMDYMIAQVKQAGAKVILIGDNNQFAAVGMSGALKVASDIAGSHKLTEVRRQKDPEQARATQLLGAYKIDEVIELYNKQGVFNISSSKEEAQKLLVSDYINSYINQAKHLAKDDLAAIKSIAICAYTNEAVSRFNQQVRGKLKEAGIIKGLGETFRVGNKTLELMRGEQIVFEANDQRNGILNGEVGTVISFSRIKSDKSGEFDKLGHGIIKILVGKADGSKKLINIDTRQRSARFTYGYAMTAYKLQGASIDHTLIYYQKEVGYEAFNVMMTRHRDSVRLYANRQELEDNVYNRLDLDAEQARKKYNLAITTKPSSRNLLSANWPLWQIGLSIGVSKRVNNSLASDYIGMGESSNDKLLKSYIESHSNVVKLLREIERWRNFEQKITGRKPNMWEHEAWDKVVEYKNIRDSAAKFIVDHRPKFQDRINQMELNYATIAKHSNVSSYSYSVSEKQLGSGSQIASNEHYRKIIDLITKLQNELHDKQDKFSNSNTDTVTNTVNSKESQIKVKEFISSINSSYKSLQEDIIENRLEFDHRKKEYDQVRNHHSILKEQIKEAENYRNQLMPEFLKRIYREEPETILEKWQEVILEHGSARLASTAVYKNPQILGKLRGIGFGRMYGITNSRVDALENTMVIGERLRKYESSLNTITENSNELRENNYAVQEESLEAAMNKVILIEPTKAEQGFIQLVEQIITTATVQNPTTQGIDTIDLKRLKDQLDKALIARKSIGQVLTSQDIKETINSAKEVIKSQAQVIIQAQTKTQTQNQDQTETKTQTQNQAQTQTKTLEFWDAKKDQSMQSQAVNKANSDNNFNNQDSAYKTRMNKLQAQIKDVITNLNTAKQLPKKINIDRLQEITYLSIFSRINGTRNDQELFTASLTANQIKALVVRNFFEIKYEKEINDILQGIWYTYNDDKPMPVYHRIKYQIDASRITKMSGYLIEQMIIDDPKFNQYSQLKKLANQVILESIQKYQTRGEEIKKALATNVIIQKSASYGKKVQHSIAEQLTDHIWQGGSKQITDEQFELMKKTAQLEQRLIPMIRQQCREELLQEASTSLLANDKSLNKDIEACTYFAINKIRANVYTLVSNKDSTSQILVAKHQDTQELNLLSPEDYDKIIKQTIDYFNKAQEQLRIEQELQQDRERQQLKQNRNLLIKL